MIDLHYPLHSLQNSSWFKLICGASFQHLPVIRNLILAYTLAGADCIDVAADPAVISVAKEALRAALPLIESAQAKGFACQGLPWLMVSFNDGEDPHFRKAEFIAENCPSDCPRPCEKICPVSAINLTGVISDRCYGCGRCLPVCPFQHIVTRAYVSTPTAIAPLVFETGVDAIEIHTQIGRLSEFRRLWEAISASAKHLKLIAISCPDGDGLIDYLMSLYDMITPLPCPLIWQTDGRPMSGDIGIGATRSTIKLAQKVIAAKLPGYVQLAGGTNHHTVPKLQSLGLLEPSLKPSKASVVTKTKPSIAGVAYGSYARSLLTPVLHQLEARDIALPPVQPTKKPLLESFSAGTMAAADHPIDAFITLPSLTPPNFHHLEEIPELLWQAVQLANSLVSQLKRTA